jgi:hypothetical protein
VEKWNTRYDTEAECCANIPWVARRECVLAWFCHKILNYCTEGIIFLCRSIFRKCHVHVIG